MTIARPFEWFFGIGPNDFWIIKPNDHYLGDPTMTQVYWVLLALGLIWAIRENWTSVTQHFKERNYLILFGIFLVFLLSYQIFKVSAHLLMLIIEHVDWTRWTPEEHY